MFILKLHITGGQAIILFSINLFLCYYNYERKSQKVVPNSQVLKPGEAGRKEKGPFGVGPGIKHRKGLTQGDGGGISGHTCIAHLHMVQVRLRLSKTMAKMGYVVKPNTFIC